MKTAATSYSTRDLLSVRYMNHFNTLFGFLRVIFLSLIGLLIGGLLSLPYMDHASIPLIVSSSAVLIPFLAVFFWNPVSRVVFIRVFYGFSCGFCFPLRWDFCIPKNKFGVQET